MGIESLVTRNPMPGVLAVSGGAVSFGATCAAAALVAHIRSAIEHKAAFRCTRHDRDARASGAGSQVHRPPVYFTP